MGTTVKNHNSNKTAVSNKPLSAHEIVLSQGLKQIPHTTNAYLNIYGDVYYLLDDKGTLGASNVKDREHFQIPIVHSNGRIEDVYINTLELAQKLFKKEINEKTKKFFEAVQEKRAEKLKQTQKEVENNMNSMKEQQPQLQQQTQQNSIKYHHENTRGHANNNVVAAIKDDHKGMYQYGAEKRKKTLETLCSGTLPTLKELTTNTEQYKKLPITSNIYFAKDGSIYCLWNGKIYRKQYVYNNGNSKSISCHYKGERIYVNTEKWFNILFNNSKEETKTTTATNNNMATQRTRHRQTSLIDTQTMSRLLNRNTKAISSMISRGLIPQYLIAGRKGITNYFYADLAVKWVEVYMATSKGKKRHIKKSELDQPIHNENSIVKDKIQAKEKTIEKSKNKTRAKFQAKAKVIEQVGIDYVAQQTNLSYKTIYNHIQSGAIPSTMLISNKRRIIFNKELVNEWIKSKNEARERRRINAENRRKAKQLKQQQKQLKQQAKVVVDKPVDSVDNNTASTTTANTATTVAQKPIQQELPFNNNNTFVTGIANTVKVEEKAEIKNETEEMSENKTKTETTNEQPIKVDYGKAGIFQRLRFLVTGKLK